MTTQAPRFIVAEVSKNWIDGGHEIEPGLLAERFEHIINVNTERGYALRTFSLHRMMTSLNSMNETIIAVFEYNRDDDIAALARRLPPSKTTEEGF
jgi:hypothetical protein